MPEVFVCASTRLSELACMSGRTLLQTVFCSSRVFDQVRQYVDKNSNSKWHVVDKDSMRTDKPAKAVQVKDAVPGFIGVLMDERFVRVTPTAEAFLGSAQCNTLWSSVFHNTYIVHTLDQARAFCKHTRALSPHRNDIVVCYDETERSAKMLKAGGVAIAGGGAKKGHSLLYGVFPIKQLLEIEALSEKIQDLESQLNKI